MSRLTKVLGLLLPFVAAMSCGGGGYTKGTYCSDIAHPICQRVVECDSTVLFADCMTFLHGTCCGDSGTCAQKPDNHAAQVAAMDDVNYCADVIYTWDCSYLNYYYNPYLPAACSGALG